MKLARNVAAILVALLFHFASAQEHSLRGVIVDAKGSPVAGATVTCNSVRTPGEGLISGNAKVISDKQGRFQIYLGPPEIFSDSPNFEFERATQTPVANSRYTVRVDPPAGSGLFPVVGTFSNIAEARITMQPATLNRRIRFVEASGAVIKYERDQPSIWLIDGEHRVHLAEEYFARSGKLIPGTYHAEGATREFESVNLRDDGSTEIVFRLKAPVTYRGSVVRADTGEPLRNAFVLLTSGTTQKTLADLQPSEWQQLASLPTKPDAGDKTLQPLRACFGDVFDMARTDSQGRFQVTEPQGGGAYGLMAVTENFLPLMRRVYSIKKPGLRDVTVPTLNLVPAAKVRVTPVVDPTKGIHITSKWKIDKSRMPDWANTLFRRDISHQDEDYLSNSYLRNNKSQLIFVPAGVPLKLRFRPSSEDPVGELVLDQQINLRQGEVHDVGEFKLPDALKVKVRVLDTRQKPVVGAPVRKMQDAENVWTVVHNTDANGTASFYIHPNSSGKFRCWESYGGKPPERPEVSFRVGTSVPDGTVYTLNLSVAHLKLIFGTN